MKTVLNRFALIIALVGMVSAGPLGFFPVSPQGTFLPQSTNDVCSEYNIPGCSMVPTFIDLMSLGVLAGDTIAIASVGGLCFYAAPNCTVFPPDLGAAFSDGNTILPPSNRNRLPGAIPGTVLTGLGLIGINQNLDAFAGGLVTTVPVAFYLSATVIVPIGADYLVVGVLDSAFADNSSSFLGVTVDDLTVAASVAEPATGAAMVAAIAALGLLRHKRLAPE